MTTTTFRGETINLDHAGIDYMLPRLRGSAWLRYELVGAYTRIHRDDDGEEYAGADHHIEISVWSLACEDGPREVYQWVDRGWPGSSGAFVLRHGEYTLNHDQAMKEARAALLAARSES